MTIPDVHVDVATIALPGMTEALYTSTVAIMTAVLVAAGEQDETKAFKRAAQLLSATMDKVKAAKAKHSASQPSPA